MSDRPTRELATATIRTMITPTTKTDFESWAARRNWTLSTAVRMLIEDAISRDRHPAPEAAYRPLVVYPHGESVAPSGAVYDPACGMFHDRALGPDERCPWAVETDGAALPAPYKPLPS